MTTPAGTGGESISYYRSRPRRRSTLSLTIRTALLAGLASVVIAAGLALQMAAGADPALKAGAQGADSQRKIVRTTVVRRVAGLGEGSGTGAASAPPISSAPVVSSPAPVTSSTS